MARLLVIGTAHALDLPSQRSTFGTAPDNTVPMAEGFELSARHFQVTPVPAGNLLVDMTGQQATLVNDQPVSQVMLKNGDVIKAGKLALRYECIPVPPPLPPEDPIPSPAPMSYGAPSLGQPAGPAFDMRSSYVPGGTRANTVAYEKGGKSSVPNVATAVHLYKWMLPVMGLLIWLGKWCYTIYSVGSEVGNAETRSTAYALVEEFRQAHEAKAPLIENVHDAGRAVRLLCKGVYGGGQYADREFKVEISEDKAEEALEYLMWREGTGLTLKHEYRDKESERYEEEDDTTIKDSEEAEPDEA